MNFSEIPKKYQQAILGVMSPGDWDLLEEGLSPDEAEQLFGAVKSTRRRTELELGDPLAPTPELPESLRHIEEVTHSIFSATTPLTFMLATRRTEDAFRYSTSPAIATMIEGGSDLARALGGAVMSAETQKHEFGSNLRNIVLGAGLAVDVGRLASRVLRNTQAATRALAWLGRFRNIKNVATAAGGVSGGPIVAALSYLAGELAYWVGSTVISGYAYRQASSEFAARTFDKSRIRDELTPLVGIAPLGSGDGYGELRRLTRGNHLGEDLPLLEGVGQNASLSALGYNYQRASEVLRRHITSLPTSYDTSHSLVGIGGTLAETSFGGDVDGVMRALVPLTQISSGDKGKITEEFLGFFGSLSGDGTLIVSQLELVGALAEFSRVYGYLGKFNTNAPQNMARVVHLLGGSETLSIQSADAIARGVTTLDEMMLAGASLSNPQANLLLAQSGITRAEAIRGLTGDAGLLDKLLGGISRMAGIGHSDYGADGRLGDGALLRLSSFVEAGFGNSAQDIGFIVDALETRYRGDAYDPSASRRITFTAAEEVRAHASMAVNSAPMKLLSEIAEQNILFSETVIANADKMITLDDITFTVLQADLFAGNLVADFSEDIMRLMDVYHNPHATRGMAGLIATTLNFYGIEKPRVHQYLPVSPEPEPSGSSRASPAPRMEMSGAALPVPGVLGAGRFDNIRVTSMPGIKYGKDVPELTGQLHQGIDIVLPGGGERNKGAPVYNLFSDTITILKNEESQNGGGNMLVIETARGVQYLLLHFDRPPDLPEGARVAPGEYLGRQGETGIASGPHLHIALSASRGDPNNPNFSQEEFFTELSIDAPDFVKAVFPEMYRLYGPRDSGMSNNQESHVNIEIVADFIDSKEGLARFLVDGLEMFA